jgi:hypothetical protein
MLPLLVAVLGRGLSGPVIGEWAAGNNTLLSIANGRARAIRRGSNPRISRHVTRLAAGSTYRVRTRTYNGPGVSQVVFRVSATQNLTSGDYAQVNSTGEIDTTFTAPAGGSVYIGIVPVTGADDQYGETDETFALTG